MALFLLTIFAQAQEPFLRVLDGDELLLELPLAAESAWILRWNHSVTGVTVSDYYRWNSEAMLLTDSHTPAFDAGLGHIPGRGRQLSDGQNGYFILDIDEPVPTNAYILRVGSRRVDHRIVHGGRSYSLSELAAGKPVSIEVTQR